MSPLCESYVRPEHVNGMEAFYPLHVLVCRSCWLVQLEQYVSADDIFTEYAYFSSFSTSWVDHVRRYAEDMCARFDIDSGSQVVELASNDGYLLQWFVEAGVPVLGIEPAANVAAAAEERGVPTMVKFFGRELAIQLAVQGTSRRPPDRQQRARAGSRPERLRRRHEDVALADRCRDHRVPACHAAARGEPVRHDLPRALLVLLALHGVDDPGRPRARGVRRRRAADARRITSHLRPPRRRPHPSDRTSRQGAPGTRGRGTASPTSTGTGSSPHRSKRRSAPSSSCSSV